MAKRAEGRLGPIEWPTMLLAIVIHAGWLTATWLSDRVSPWVLVAIGGWLVTWHGSLQHETIHGHPTRSARLNSLIAGLPLALWLPYACYRRDHIAHHATEAVTDPRHDPESRYLWVADGRGGNLRRASARAQGPLTGRLLLGPFDIVLSFLIAEARRVRREPAAAGRDWAPHFLGLVAVGAWLAVCHVSLALYLVAFVYPGTALTLLRSYVEHRAAATPGHRVAVVEGSGPLALLFLNNNLHAAHHRAPGLPWFRLPAFYRQHRAEILRENGGLLYLGYGDVVRRFAFRPHDVVLHPHGQS